MTHLPFERPIDLVCLGEPMLELNLQPGDSSGVRLYLEAHGGDTSNVAIAAARQGARAAYLSAVGDDPAGASFLALWAREGVAATAVHIDPDHATGLYFVTHDAAGHHFSYVRRNSAASHYRLDDAGRAVIGQARVLFASGISLAIGEGAATTVLEAMSVARKLGTRVAFDTNYRPKLWSKERAATVITQAMRQADLVFPGLEDAQLLLDLHEPDAIADLCLSMGAAVVVLKMGSAGALLATPQGRTRIAPFPCVPVDATGAGDTFCGSFLAEVSAGRSLEEAGAYAACAAALATTGYGAVPPIPYKDSVAAALRAGSPV